MSFEGSTFTWTNNCVKERFDRGLTSSTRKDFFFSHKVIHFLDGTISYYFPILIETHIRKQKLIIVNETMADVLSFVNKLEEIYFLGRDELIMISHIRSIVSLPEISELLF